MEILIRLVSLEDINPLFAIYRSAMDSSPYPIGPTWTQAQFEQSSAGGLVLLIDTHPGAFIFFDDLGSALEISMLATDSRYLRQGLMKRLLSHLVALVRTRAGGEVWLDVHEQNVSARGLYETLGFKKVGTRTRYYADGGDAILYSCG